MVHSGHHVGEFRWRTNGGGLRRHIAIDRVGVKDVTYPIRLLVPEGWGGGEQTTVAKVNMYVSLPHYQKGTHMSRFLEVLNQYAENALTPDCFQKVARAICEGGSHDPTLVQTAFVSCRL